jgi:hypothetical protein
VSLRRSKLTGFGIRAKAAAVVKMVFCGGRAFIALCCDERMASEPGILGSEKRMSLKQSTLGYSRKQRTRSGTQEENSERKPAIHSTTFRSYLFTIFVSVFADFVSGINDVN